MNKKCKKIGIFIGLTMAIAGMTACGETEPEETPVVKEETAKPTETPAPTATSTRRLRLPHQVQHRPRFLNM